MRVRPGWLYALASLGLSCSPNTPRYFAPEAPLLAGAEGMASVSVAVQIPFRRPTDEERTTLEAKSRTLGFGAPFVSRRHVDVSIQYTITNVSGQAGWARVFVNGANEYTSYDLGAIEAQLATLMVPEDARPTLWSLIEGTKLPLAAGATYTGQVREDEFVEAARDLDAIGRFMAPYLTVLLNDSRANPAGMELVPANVDLPQLQTVIVTFAASVPMRLDFLVRVRDQAGLLAEGNEPRFMPTPTPFVPLIEGAVPVNMMPGMPGMTMPPGDGGGP